MMQLQPGSEISEVDIDHFFSQCHTREYHKNDLIVRQDQISDRLYFLLNGSVTVVRHSEEGKDIVMAYLNSGAFFGEMGLFEQQQKRSATIRARTDCKVASISYEKFHQLSQERPSLLFAISAQLTSRLRETSKKVVDLAFLDVTGRVAACLLTLRQQPDATPHSDGMLLKITRQELSRHVGCTREMVGRVLKDLEEQKLIQLQGQSILVLDDQ